MKFKLAQLFIHALKKSTGHSMDLKFYKIKYLKFDEKKHKKYLNGFFLNR